ncbi:hypothetical protein BDV93DRAFT_227989 [Ceratobasidium sp. AG-I]|nr:hypothetical protein BDV93DRAFT_227989 [Ceratobasidium sp. AG-I]
MAAGNRKSASEKGKGKASANKRHRNNDNDDDRVEDRMDEDASEPDRPQKRARKETARKRDAHQNDEDDREARREQRQATERRRQERADEQAASLFVEDDNEPERVTLLRTAALDLRAENARLEAELAQARALSRRQHQQELDGASSSAGASGSGTSGVGTSTSAPDDSDWPADDSIRPPLRVSNVTMADIRTHLGVANDDTQWLRIRALLRDFMCLAALDFSVPWRQQDKIRLGNLYALIRERIPRFCRFANNWAGELVVQDIFNHRRTHLLKLERESKNSDPCRATQTRNGKHKNGLEINC